MTPFDLARAADELAAARVGVRQIGALPVDATPNRLEDAYRVQAELARRAGGYSGWKVGALTAEQQARAGVDRPTAARLMHGFVHASPARLPHARYINPRLECELAFVLARDLPPRLKPYGEDEVADALAGMALAIEIADSRLPAGSPLALVLADGMGNGAFIHGATIARWRDIDRDAAAVTLRIDGREAATGRGGLVLGDPFRAVVLLANHPPPGSPGLRAGEIVTTGSLTGVTPVSPGAEAVADFGALGDVRVRL